MARRESPQPASAGPRTGRQMTMTRPTTHLLLAMEWAILLTVGQLASAAPQESTLEGLEVSQPAPAFALRSLDGARPVASKDVFAARELALLILWDSHCPDCLKAVAQCQTFQATGDSLGISVLSINFDREHLAAIRAFVKGEGITFPVLLDHQGAVAALYGAEDYSFSFFIIDREGTIRYLYYDKPHDVIELIAWNLAALLQQGRSRQTPAGDPDTLGVDVGHEEGAGED